MFCDRRPQSYRPRFAGGHSRHISSDRRALYYRCCLTVPSLKTVTNKTPNNLLSGPRHLPCQPQENPRRINQTISGKYSNSVFVPLLLSARLPLCHTNMFIQQIKYWPFVNWPGDAPYCHEYPRHVFNHCTPLTTKSYF